MNVYIASLMTFGTTIPNTPTTDQAPPSAWNIRNTAVDFVHPVISPFACSTKTMVDKSRGWRARRSTCFPTALCCVSKYTNPLVSAHDTKRAYPLHNAQSPSINVTSVRDAGRAGGGIPRRRARD